ncbi:MAG: hypothetical protein R2697_22085 [Ilumatobacteraceae bacterium]
MNLTGSAASRATIDGYITVPQGRVRVSNPANDPVALVGGLVVGAFDIDSATLSAMSDPVSPAKIGFEDVVLQRTVELETLAAGERITSTMRVQINANGADMRVNSWVIQ